MRRRSNHMLLLKEKEFTKNSWMRTQIKEHTHFNPESVK